MQRCAAAFGGAQTNQPVPSTSTSSQSFAPRHSLWTLCQRFPPNNSRHSSQLSLCSTTAGPVESPRAEPSTRSPLHRNGAQPLPAQYVAPPRNGPVPVRNALSLTATIEKVSVLTLDGRTMVGMLESCDGSMNLVLSEAVERIIRPREEDVPSEEVPLGLYIIRGDSVAVVGRVEEELDASIDWTQVRGEVLGTTKHV
jgi:U6 snRNA-associated Sm-like protein LSm8